MDFVTADVGTLFSTYLSSKLDSSSPIFWLEENLILMTNMLKKVLNWSEVHLSEMTCYKIHTLVRWSWYTSTYLYSPSGAPSRFKVSMTTVVELEGQKFGFFYEYVCLTRLRLWMLSQTETIIAKMLTLSKFLASKLWSC